MAILPQASGPFRPVGLCIGASFAILAASAVGGQLRGKIWLCALLGGLRLNVWKGLRGGAREARGQA